MNPRIVRLLNVVILIWVLSLQANATASPPRFQIQGPGNFQINLFHLVWNCSKIMRMALPAIFFRQDRTSIEDAIAEEPTALGQMVLIPRDNEWQDILYVGEAMRNVGQLVQWIRSYSGARNNFSETLNWHAELIETRNPHDHLRTFLNLEGNATIKRMWQVLEDKGWRIHFVPWVDFHGFPSRISYGQKLITLGRAPTYDSYPVVVMETIAGVFVDDLVQQNYPALYQRLSLQLAAQIADRTEADREAFIRASLMIWMKYSARLLSTQAYKELVEAGNQWLRHHINDTRVQLLNSGRTILFRRISMAGGRFYRESLPGYQHVSQALGDQTIEEYLNSLGT